MEDKSELGSVTDLDNENRITELEGRIKELTDKYTELYGYVKKISKVSPNKPSSETKPLNELFT